MIPLSPLVHSVSLSVSALVTDLSTLFTPFFILLMMSSSGSWDNCRIKNSGLSKVTSLLSFTPVSRPVILDKASALPIDLPGLCTSSKEYSESSVTHRACRRLSFCGHVIQFSVVLDWLESAIFLFDKEEWRSHGGRRGANTTCTKIFLKKLVECLLFIKVKWVYLAIDWFGSGG